MAFEVDYLPVGLGDKSGDAIALRYGNLSGRRDEQTVVVIDGGTLASGEALVNHIQTQFKTDAVDIMISTHPDGDHASGLRVVMENMDVTTLMMHQPWNHAADIRSMFRDGRLTDNSLEQRLRNNLQTAHDLEEAALEKGVRIVEPFAGARTENGVMIVLGPNKDYYQSLLPQFRQTPVAKTSLAEFYQKAVDAVTWVRETMFIETLRDDGEDTQPNNNSSAIVFFNIEGHRLLFTGDAGKAGLLRVADYAAREGISLTGLDLLHVPHHGSKRNVGPTVLDLIQGDLAIISAAKGGEPKHPSKKVINALIRRGSTVYTTQGKGLWYQHNAPARTGWDAYVSPQSFYDQVEE